MKTFSPNEVAELAESLSIILCSCFDETSLLHGNQNVAELVRFLRGINVACLDFETEGLDKDKGFEYIPEDHIFLLNYRTIQMIFENACKLQYYRNAGKEDILRDVVALYFFHEAFHVPQGIGDFEHVQLIKKVAGKSQLGEFDTLADFVSARAYAAVLAFSHDGSIEVFLKIFSECLYKSYTVGLRSFPFTPGDKHKIERGLSLFVVQNRVLKKLSLNIYDKEVSRGLYVRIDPEDGHFLVFTLEDTPAKSLLLVKGMTPDVSKNLAAAVAFGNVKYIEECLSDFQLAA